MSLDISCPCSDIDFELCSKVIQQGIDSRLEGFTRSKFTVIHDRLLVEFHEEEIQILLRRLSEMEDEGADFWIEQIVLEQYGVETR